LIVTRHAALVDYLRELGVDDSTPVKSHVSADDVRGRHVCGVLPMHLAAEAASVTEIPLALTPEDRGQELSIDRIREIAGDPRTYFVRGTTTTDGRVFTRDEAADLARLILKWEAATAAWPRL